MTLRLPLLVGWITLLALVSSTTLAQDYIFHFDTTASGPTGSVITTRALIDNPGGPLAGWSIGICHEDTMDFLEITDGNAPMTANAGGPADFVQTNHYPGFGANQGVVVNFVGLNELPIASDHEAITMQTMLLGPDDTTSTMSFCNAVFPGETSEFENLAVAPGGIAIVPTMMDGIVEIGGLLPFELSAVPSAPSVEQGNSIDVQIMLNAPVENYGFSLGFAHSDAALTLVGADTGTALAVLNGGSGPEYLTLDLDPEGASGLIVACLYSVSSLLALPAGNGQELIVAHYDAPSTAPLGITGLNFSEDLVPQSPSPPTAIVISLGQTSGPVVTSGTSIEILEGVVGVQFQRGDFDGSGSLNLGDPVNLLGYMFNGGAAPLCEKIGDIDDSGSIVLGDPVQLLTYMFSGGSAPAEPFDQCGIDPTEDDLTCEEFDACP